MKRILIGLIFLIGIGHPMTAQDTGSDEIGSWYILASNSKLSERVSVQLQTQLRFFELISELQQFKVRTSVTYKAMDGLSFALGYAYFRNDFSYLSEDPPAFDEHRIVEDIILQHALGKVAIKHRLRLENRFIVRNGETDVRHWYRQEIKFSVPIATAWAADVYNEIWLNLEEPIFAQNWLGGGITYKASNLIKTRLGYQRIMLEGPDFDRILVGLTFTPDFSKKKTP